MTTHPKILFEWTFCIGAYLYKKLVLFKMHPNHALNGKYPQIKVMGWSYAQIDAVIFSPWFQWINSHMYQHLKDSYKRETEESHDNTIIVNVYLVLNI